MLKINRKAIGWLISLPLLLTSYGVLAKDLNVAVQLTSIQAIKASEKGDDEVYFSISEYPSNTEPKLFRAPMFPLHWLAKELGELKNITLWQGTLKPKESTLVILSLLEQDLEPWNADDHLGSVQVKLTNKDGQLVTQWGLPKFKDQVQIEQPQANVPNFVMVGKNSQYAVKLKVVNF